MSRKREEVFYLGFFRLGKSCCVGNTKIKTEESKRPNVKKFVALAPDG